MITISEKKGKKKLLFFYFFFFVIHAGEERMDGITGENIYFHRNKMNLDRVWSG